ncbi:acyl-CoA dehydrogenase family protein [Sandaracinobacteroides hominis]|uniref:acyl-CoA dehydrogenase family protein n=1 Tax=Sandaracinobacteroides hominis TaxID=2780086 RepID=UPI0018F7558D|nr:acyl-CoA dehydrogenase family protein [Sandaracinobacteroides hominis]
MRNRLSTEELEAFLDSLRRLLADRCTEADVRRVMESRDGHDAALWKQLAEMGVAGLAIEPEHGGLGAGPAVLERAMEELGAVLAPTPILSSVLAASLLEGLEAAGRLLPGIADGSTIAAVALTGPKAKWTAETVGVEASPRGNGWQLEGRAAFVLHAGLADVLLVAARTADGIGLFELSPKAEGVAVSALPAFDRTLSMADVRFAGADAVRLSPAGDFWPEVEQALDLARVALAGEQAGGARRVFEITVDYARERHQFGRSIGSFQAIKHMAADLLLESESAISAARHAGTALAEGAEDAGQSVSLAAFACADAFSRVTADSIQMHGGIAFTWVNPVHLYLRRARADAQLFGTPAAMRERFVQQLGG